MHADPSSHGTTPPFEQYDPSVQAPPTQVDPSLHGTTPLLQYEPSVHLPSTHFEPLQFLRYLACDHADADDCQFYRRHHDTVPEMVRMQPGPRVYTMFLYLSDVEEGGGTKFDSGFTVTPKKGRAVLWPATKNDEPFVSDDRTYHEALPVTKGTKYAANFWLHQYDYVTPHHSGCTA